MVPKESCDDVGDVGEAAGDGVLGDLSELRLDIVEDVEGRLGSDRQAAMSPISQTVMSWRIRLLSLTMRT